MQHSSLYQRNSLRLLYQIVSPPAVVTPRLPLPHPRVFSAAAAGGSSSSGHSAFRFYSTLRCCFAYASSVVRPHQLLRSSVACGGVCRTFFVLRSFYFHVSPILAASIRGAFCASASSSSLSRADKGSLVSSCFLLPQQTTESHPLVYLMTVKTLRVRAAALHCPLSGKQQHQTCRHSQHQPLTWQRLRWARHEQQQRHAHHQHAHHLQEHHRQTLLQQRQQRDEEMEEARGWELQHQKQLYNHTRRLQYHKRERLRIQQSWQYKQQGDYYEMRNSKRYSKSCRACYRLLAESPPPWFSAAAVSYVPFCSSSQAAGPAEAAALKEPAAITALENVPTTGPATAFSALAAGHVHGSPENLRPMPSLDEETSGCRMTEPIDESTYLSVFERIYEIQHQSETEKSSFSTFTPNSSSSSPCTAASLVKQPVVLPSAEMNDETVSASWSGTPAAHGLQLAPAHTHQLPLHAVRPTKLPVDSPALSHCTSGEGLLSSAKCEVVKNVAEPSASAQATNNALHVFCTDAATQHVSSAAPAEHMKASPRDPQHHGTQFLQQLPERLAHKTECSHSQRYRQRSDQPPAENPDVKHQQRPYISKHVLVCALADLARSGVRIPQAWQSVLLLVLLELPRFSARQLQQAATALQRGSCCCPLVLQGLAEAFYWRCQEKKGDVQDCVLLLDALRRLRYRPSLRHVNKIVERLREGREKLTVSLCLKLLRFFVETHITAVDLKHPTFYWGVLATVQHSIASLHPPEVVAFARLLPRLNVRDEAVYERLCLHLYNRSKDVINANIRTAASTKEAVLSPGMSALAAVAPFVAPLSQQQNRACILNEDQEDAGGKKLHAVSAITTRMENSCSSLQYQQDVPHYHQAGHERQQQIAYRPVTPEPIREDAAFLPTLLYLGRACVQAQLRTLPIAFWLASDLC